MRDSQILAAWTSGRLAECVEAVLGVLLGQPFEYMGRAANMAWLGFGELREVADHSGGTRKLAVHALHLQCPFRLAGAEGPIAAAHDMYYSSVDPLNPPEGFDPDVHGTTWYDTRVARFVDEHGGGRLLVESVKADASGGFRLVLTEGYTLEVFPATSFQEEHWRYFQPYGRHFVILPDGVEDDEAGDA